MNNEEFLRLVTHFFNQHYDEPEPEIEEESHAIIQRMETAPRLAPNYSDKIIDLTDTKGTKLTEKIQQSNNIKIGKFILKVQRKYDKIDVSIYENFKSGRLSKIDVLKDNRFKTTSWSKHFNSFKIGKDVPAEQIVDIARWLQAVEKIGAFL